MASKETVAVREVCEQVGYPISSPHHLQWTSMITKEERAQGYRRRLWVRPDLPKVRKSSATGLYDYDTPKQAAEVVRDALRDLLGDTVSVWVQ